MRTMNWVAAALVLAFATACEDRDRDETASRADNAAEEAGGEVREGAKDAGNAVEDAANDAGDAVDNVADGLADYSYDRRGEFRTEVRQRLDALDRELAESERHINEDASDARKKAVAAARDARNAVERSLERIGDVTSDNWDNLREEIGDALSTAELRVKELRPDSKPMGGTGGPS
jgi:phosphate uptake regulator